MKLDAVTQLRYYNHIQAEWALPVPAVAALLDIETDAIEALAAGKGELPERTHALLREVYTKAPDLDWDDRRDAIIGAIMAGEPGGFWDYVDGMFETVTMEHVPLDLDAAELSDDLRKLF